MRITNRKIHEFGNGTWVLIPTQYLKDGYIDSSKIYDIELKEVKNDKS
jgi:hypothetical protein